MSKNNFTILEHLLYTKPKYAWRYRLFDCVKNLYRGMDTEYIQTAPKLTLICMEVLAAHSVSTNGGFLRLLRELAFPDYPIIYQTVDGNIRKCSFGNLPTDDTVKSVIKITSNKIPHHLSYLQLLKTNLLRTKSLRYHLNTYIRHTYGTSGTSILPTNNDSSHIVRGCLVGVVSSNGDLICVVVYAYRQAVEFTMLKSAQPLDSFKVRMGFPLPNLDYFYVCTETEVQFHNYKKHPTIVMLPTTTLTPPSLQ